MFEIRDFSVGSLSELAQKNLVPSSRDDPSKFPAALDVILAYRYELLYGKDRNTVMKEFSHMIPDTLTNIHEDSLSVHLIN